MQKRGELMSYKDIRPPEVPFEFSTKSPDSVPEIQEQSAPKKKGVLSKLFGRKPKESLSSQTFQDSPLHEFPFHSDSELEALSGQLKDLEQKLAAPAETAEFTGAATQMQKSPQESLQEAEDASSTPSNKSKKEPKKDSKKESKKESKKSKKAEKQAAKKVAKQKRYKKTANAIPYIESASEPAIVLPFESEAESAATESQASETAEPTESAEFVSEFVQAAPETSATPKRKFFFSRMFGKKEATPADSAAPAEAALDLSDELKAHMEQWLKSSPAQSSQDTQENPPEFGSGIGNEVTAGTDELEKIGENGRNRRLEGIERIEVTGTAEKTAAESAGEEHQIPEHQVKNRLNKLFLKVEEEASRIHEGLQLLKRGQYGKVPKILKSSNTLRKFIFDLNRINREHFAEYEVKNRKELALLAKKLVSTQRKIEKVRTQVLHILSGEILKESQQRLSATIEEAKRALANDVIKNELYLEKIRASLPSYRERLQELRHKEESIRDIEANVKTVVEDRLKDELPKRLKAEQGRMDAKLHQLEKERAAAEREKLSLGTSVLQHDEAKRKVEAKVAVIESQYRKKAEKLECQRKAFEAEKRHALATLRQAAIIHPQVEALMKKRAALEERSHLFQERQRQWKTAVEAEEKLIESEEVGIEQLEKHLSKARAAVEKERENVDKLEFDKYIESRLREIKPSLTIETPVLLNPRSSHAIYETINQCKKMIASKEFDKSKELYNTAKRQFVKDHFSQQEKSLLYNILRELYTEISLGILG